MEVTISKMDWKGLHPQRFEKGRVHLRPVDQLGANYEGLAPAILGRRHFDPSLSGTYEHKYSIRPSAQRNQESLIHEPLIKSKLVYIPSQKKAKPDLLLRDTRKNERERFGRRIGMMTFKEMHKNAVSSAANHSDDNQRVLMMGVTTKNALKLAWNDRDRIQQENEDKQLVQNLDIWEERRQNPNYYLLQKKQSYSEKEAHNSRGKSIGQMSQRQQ